MSEQRIEIAKLFHNKYEELAPKYGYITREDTKDFDPESPNGKLMIEVCNYVEQLVRQQARDEIKERLRQYKPENGNIITADRRWLEKKLFGEGEK